MVNVAAGINNRGQVVGAAEVKGGNVHDSRGRKTQE